MSNPRNVMRITHDNALAVIDALGTRYFGITYVTRGIDRKTGLSSVKRMTASRNYAKWLVGGDATYSATERGLLTVCDIKALHVGLAKVANGETDRVRPIRSFDPERLLELRANGVVYRVVCNDYDCPLDDTCQGRDSEPHLEEYGVL